MGSTPTEVLPASFFSNSLLRISRTTESNVDFVYAAPHRDESFLCGIAHFPTEHERNGSLLKTALPNPFCQHL